MGKILSQEEIDALLGAAAVSAEPAASADHVASDQVIRYNFRRPDRVSKEQMRSLHFLHDRFARNLSGSLSAYLRTVSEVAIVSVEQFTYSEVLMSLADPTAFYALATPPHEALGALEVNPSVAFTMIDRMLGGSGRASSITRALTEIEQNVVDAVVRLIIDNLTEVWRSLVDIEFKVQGRETRPQMLQVAAPNEIVILIVFDARIGESCGMFNLVVPASLIEQYAASFNQGWTRTRPDPTREDRLRLFDNLGRVRLPTTVLIESQLSTRDLLSLQPGDVVSLGHDVDRPVEVRIGRRPKFKGRLVRTERGAGIEIATTGRSFTGVA